MQAYAENRPTKDVDMLIDLNLSNLERAYALPGLLTLFPPTEGLESWANPDFRKIYRKPGQALVCRCSKVGIPTLDMILELAEPLNALDIISRAIEFPTDKDIAALEMLLSSSPA